MRLGTSIEYSEMPPRNGYERAEIILSGWILKPLENGVYIALINNKSTEAVTIGSINLKGNLTSLANSEKGSSMQVNLVKKLVAYLGKLKS
jgi:hypothetical protein